MSRKTAYAIVIASLLAGIALNATLGLAVLQVPLSLLALAAAGAVAGLPGRGMALGAGLGAGAMALDILAGVSGFIGPAGGYILARSATGIAAAIVLAGMGGGVLGLVGGAIGKQFRRGKNTC